MIFIRQALLRIKSPSLYAEVVGGLNYPVSPRQLNESALRETSLPDAGPARVQSSWADLTWICQDVKLEGSLAYRLGPDM